MYNQQAVHIEILRSQSDVSYLSFLFQLYDLPETSVDNGAQFVLFLLSWI